MSSLLVGVMGIEPTTSRPPDERASTCAIPRENDVVLQGASRISESTGTTKPGQVTLGFTVRDVRQSLAIPVQVPWPGTGILPSLKHPAID